MALNWLLSLGSTILLNGSKAAMDEAAVKKAEAFFNGGSFQMPLHYPRYARSDYEKMEEWQLDLLLRQYGLSFDGGLEEKRKFAMGAFLWPDQF